MASDKRCINWNKATDKDGYGVTWHGGKRKKGGKSYRAHVWAYLQAKGKIPKGKVLDHLCGNRKCVNVLHPEPVTQQINAQRGGSTKLKPEDVIQIRKIVLSGKSQREVARQYNLEHTAVWSIINGRSWANI